MARAHKTDDQWLADAKVKLESWGFAGIIVGAIQSRTWDEALQEWLFNSTEENDCSSKGDWKRLATKTLCAYGVRDHELGEEFQEYYEALTAIEPVSLHPVSEEDFIFTCKISTDKKPEKLSFEEMNSWLSERATFDIERFSIDEYLVLFDNPDARFEFKMRWGV